MRYFIALELPEPHKQQLHSIQTQLTKILPGIRLTDNDKLHLTIAFLDEQPDDLKDDLIQLIRDSVKGIAPFEVTPSYIDGFPNLHKAHTLWMGVNGDVDKLFRIRERIKDGLKNLNISIDERRYTPHIAIAKAIRLHLSHEQETQLEQLASQPIDPITVESIKLFESIPSHGFHTHNTLAEISLKS